MCAGAGETSATEWFKAAIMVITSGGFFPEKEQATVGQSFCYRLLVCIISVKMWQKSPLLSEATVLLFINSAICKIWFSLPLTDWSTNKEEGSEEGNTN